MKVTHTWRADGDRIVDERWICDDHDVDLICPDRKGHDMTATTWPRPIPTESDIPMHGWAPYSDVHRERIRAHAKHDANGGSMERKPWDDPMWLPVLTEELGEVARVLCDRELGIYDNDDARAGLTEELTQMAAMASAWLDAVQHQPPGQS